MEIWRNVQQKTKGKVLDIDKIFKNRLNTIKNLKILFKFWNNDSRVLGVIPRGLRKVLDHEEPYPTTPHNLKSVLWFKSYSTFSNQCVLKPRRLDLGKKLKKNPLRNLLCNNYRDFVKKNYVTPYYGKRKKCRAKNEPFLVESITIKTMTCTTAPHKYFLPRWTTFNQFFSWILI